MALENKRSLLQPSSVQAQQSRLQFSNLAPGGITPASLTNQQPAPVANARPAASVFVTAPAPVSLQAPPTIPPVLPVPAPAPAPAPPSIPLNYSHTAGFFDNNTIFTASLAVSDVDVPVVFDDKFGIMFALKPHSWTANEVVFSIYSGSFASASLEVRVQNNNINMYQWNGSGYLRRGAGGVSGQVGNLGNGYTLVTFNRTVDTGPITQALAERYSEWFINTDRRLGESGASGNYTGFFDLTASDHFDIGGIQKDPSLNFSGSIAFIAIKKGEIFTRQEITSVFQQQIQPGALTDLPGVVRVYSFESGLVTEFTGSEATTQIPLGISGSVGTSPEVFESYFKP